MCVYMRAYVLSQAYLNTPKNTHTHTHTHIYIYISVRLSLNVYCM